MWDGFQPYLGSLPGMDDVYTLYNFKEEHITLLQDADMVGHSHYDYPSFAGLNHVPLMHGQISCSTFTYLMSVQSCSHLPLIFPPFI